MITNNLFLATSEPLTIYNGQPIINFGFQFFYDDCDGGEIDFDYPSYVSSFIRVFNERLGREMKDIPLTLNGVTLVMDTTDTDFDDNGKYYYEVGYVQAGGYEIVLRFGVLTVK